MAASSKNNRRLNPASGPYTEIGAITRFVPLGANHCYMRDPRAPKSHKVIVGSEQFDTLVDEFVEVVGKDKILVELDKLELTHPGYGWGKTAKRLRG
jgi:hypothetical protein